MYLLSLGLAFADPDVTRRIHSRLIEHGWEAVDFNITHLPLVRSWEKLVEVAKPLTDRSKSFSKSLLFGSLI